MIKDCDVKMGSLEKLANAIGMPGGDYSRVSDEKNFFCANLAGEFTDALDTARAENEPSARLIIYGAQPFAFE